MRYYQLLHSLRSHRGQRTKKTASVSVVGGRRGSGWGGEKTGTPLKRRGLICSDVTGLKLVSLIRFYVFRSKFLVGCERRPGRLIVFNVPFVPPDGLQRRVNQRRFEHDRPKSEARQRDNLAEFSVNQ